MKITYISNSTIPSKTANSVHVMMMSNAISDLGHEVVLLVKSRKNNDGNEINAFQYYGVTKNFKIETIKSPKIKFGWVLYGYGCYKFVRKVQSELIYTRNLFGAYLCVKDGYKTIFECHMPPSKFWDKYFLEKIFNKDNLTIVVISNALKILLMGMFPTINESKILVAHDGFNSDWLKEDKKSFFMRENLSLNNNDFVIGYVGSLYKGRGINLILKIAKHFKNDKTLIVGGDEKEICNIKQNFNELIHDNIHFIGYVKNSEVLGYLISCSILLMPYQTDLKTANNGINTSQYMSPLKMFEYMASGRPIISSDFPVLKEILNDHNSILVEPDDLSSWVDAINKLKFDKKLRKKLASNAFDDVQKYNWLNRAGIILRSQDLSNQ